MEYWCTCQIIFQMHSKYLKKLTKEQSMSSLTLQCLSDFHGGIVSSLTVWIHKNITKNIKIEELSLISGYSPWYMQRIFKRYMGVTVGAYIRGYRVKKASEELLASNDPINDIAIHYGYDSQQTFSRVFRRHFGLSPSQFRDTVSSK